MAESQLQFKRFECPGCLVGAVLPGQKMAKFVRHVRHPSNDEEPPSLDNSEWPGSQVQRESLPFDVFSITN